MTEAICPHCGRPVETKKPPGNDPLLSHYECTSRDCPTGSIYTVDVKDAYQRGEVAAIARAMAALAAEIDSDASTIQEMMDFFRKMGR